MKIGEREISQSHPPYIIAEIGVNHDGSVSRALELVHAAGQAGADAIKLQLFQADLLLSRAARAAAYQTRGGGSSADPFQMLRSLELSIDQMNGIVHEAHSVGLHAILTVFNAQLVEQAERLDCDAYKVASPDIINRPLIEELKQTGRPLVVSAGASTLHEVEELTAWLGDYPHVLMQCVSAYPACDQCAALAGRIALCAVNPNALGYSDHTPDVDTGALAVASGARILEKHLTHNQTASGPDHAASLNPPSFAEYVRLAHRAYRMLGPLRKDVLEIEKDARQASRQSLTTRRGLSPGHLIQLDDLTIKRPGTGISPAKLQEIIGRRIARSIDADMPILQEHLE